MSTRNQGSTGGGAAVAEQNDEQTSTQWNANQNQQGAGQGSPGSTNTGSSGPSYIVQRADGQCFDVQATQLIPTRGNGIVLQDANGAIVMWIPDQLGTIVYRKGACQEVASAMPTRDDLSVGLNLFGRARNAYAGGLRVPGTMGAVGDGTGQTEADAFAEELARTQENALARGGGDDEDGDDEIQSNANKGQKHREAVGAGV